MDDAPLMRRALHLARNGVGGVHPNPLVGAVIVNGDRVVGEGWHRRVGGPHAEIHALEAAGDAARGATLYVTLEPCSHHGRTPPCTDAIHAAGIERVVIGARDPNPEASGGAAALREAGIETTEGVERDLARALNPGFHHIHETGTSYIALKLAVSLDGAIAGAPGTRTTLTGAAAATRTHELRAQHDAVIIGSGTARIDDPLLTVRHIPTVHQPTRVVLDSSAGLSPRSRLVRSVDEAPLIVVAADDAPADRLDALNAAGAEFVTVPAQGDGLDLDAVTAELAGRGLRTLFVEGGARLASRLIAEGRVHTLHLLTAPLFLGPRALRAFDLDRAQRDWTCTAAELLDPDVLTTWQRSR